MTPQEKEKQDKQNALLRDISMERKGTKLIVPEEVDLDTAIRALQLKQKEEDEVIGVEHILDAEVAEGIVAFFRVLKNEFGFVSATGTPGFFGNQKPQYTGIETSPGNKESLPMGRLMIPGVDGWIKPGYAIKNDHLVFQLFGEVKGKHRYLVDKIANLVKEELLRNSIYKGHAIETDFRDVGDCNSLEDTFPRFAKVGYIRPEQVIFSAATEEEVDISMFTPIRHTEMCRTHNIPLKRGILLEGPYGTGKTLTAAAGATLAKENGWTFIYLKDVTCLAQAYHFASRYQPAIIFAEDIDQILNDPNRRDNEVNDILNALDGIDTKGVEIITVLTTNHLEKITQAMLRPGRLDTVISVRAPDADAAQRLIRFYAGSDLAGGTNLDEASAVLAGIIPALIREVVERSKLAAIRRVGSHGGGEVKLTGEDIEITARTMKRHMEMLEPKKKDDRSEREKAAQIIADGNVHAAKVRMNPAIVVDASTYQKESEKGMPLMSSDHHLTRRDIDKVSQ
jgi:transitional endoplasmic reticulum ATPase